ncbi:acyl-CoA carboxylase epsilon subunit [Nonomuraea soli]|nr:acyl-CoA carboxylase epsilon subunit [Nonomuraea soli]
MQVVSGDATPEEIAALVAVLAARGENPATATEAKPESWRNPARSMRKQLVPGKSAWRNSALP